jgi:hypothetical protein
MRRHKLQEQAQVGAAGVAGAGHIGMGPASKLRGYILLGDFPALVSHLG